MTPHNLDMASATMQKEPNLETTERQFTPNFKPGMSATVDIQTETVQRAIAVPIQAVTVRDFAKDAANDTSEGADTDTSTSNENSIIPEEDLRKVVFLVQGGKAVRSEVETGISDNTHIQILSGVDNNDEVVIGSYRVLSKDLADGDAVTVNNNKFGTLTASN